MFILCKKGDNGTQVSNLAVFACESAWGHVSDVTLYTMLRATLSESPYAVQRHEGTHFSAT